jgi:endonuclease I
MKKIFTLSIALLATAASVFAQDGAPASPYYNGFNFNQTGMALKNALAQKITSTHVNELTYQGAENALKVVDVDPQSTNNVLLVYGFSNNICPAPQGDDNNHRRRNIEADGGGNVCEWNREHIFPQSLGTPELGQVGAGSDAHHLRACDVDRNGQRGNKFYSAGTGNSGDVASGWYPGDEWKGDVARILMYMYLRYPTQCVPTTIVTGGDASSDPNMPLLLLQWNAEDPVSEYEDNRNTYLGDASNAWGQGNRNPFIDNPYLATVIWGGPAAQNRWPFMGTEDITLASLTIYPNPSNGEVNIYSETEINDIQLINVNGQIIQQVKNPAVNSNTYKLNNLQQGFYMIRLTAGEQSVTKKIIVN